MSKRAKRRLQDRSGSSAENRSRSTPPAFLPAVLSVPDADFQFTDAQISRLEEAGQIVLSENQRADLVTLAEFWLQDLRLRRSARPKQFRIPLEKLVTVLSRAREACGWNDKVGSLERHLLHWAMEAPVPGAAVFPAALAALQHQVEIVLETAVALQQCLPPDPGRQRPFDDERRFARLADIYENAGGKAVAYASDYKQNQELNSMADTPFRKFVHQFYSMLPAEDKRNPGGLDDPLRDALAARRAQAARSEQ